MGYRLRTAHQHGVFSFGRRVAANHCIWASAGGSAAWASWVGRNYPEGNNARARGVVGVARVYFTSR